MKKSIVAVAVMGVSFPAAAEVSLYGQIRTTVSVAQTQIKGAAGTEKSHTETKINDNTSRLGFKGSERLGGDMKAIWQVEQRISTVGDNNGRWGSRDSFIGLEGRFGKIRAGNMNNQLNEMDTIDSWIYGNNALGLGIFTRTGSRKVSARYDTPSFAGFSANVQYAPRDNQNPDDKGLHEEPTRAQLDTGLNYEADKYFVKLGYNLRKNNYSDNGGKTKDAHIGRLETAYDGSKLFLGAGVQYAKGFETGNRYLARFTNDFNTYNGSSITSGSAKSESVKVVDAAVTAGYKAGNWRPKISYAHGWAAKGVNSGDVLVDKFDQIIVGSDYRFSKRTAVRGQVAHMRVGGKTRLTADTSGKVEQTAAQLGLHHRF
ncbi:porin [Neisseria sp.]|uniref:porin n=1 Tax=Neisseria sp. TaxID=192066 RepID=UPI0026DA79A3|nr:porin [Neisseria sp.]MDO4907598.1 porin [Neisseria sp.]